MYKLFIANKNYSSWSLRPWVLMRELDIAFEEHLVPFVQGSNWEAFRAFCPSGKVPCLVDNGEAIWDSLGITEHLAERHKGVWPSDPLARSWARCAAAEMHSGFSALRNQCGMNVGLRVTLHEMTPSLQADVTRIDELWNEGLQRFGGPFLAGKHFTAVDAFFAPVAFRVQTFGLTLSETAHTYCQHLLELSSMREWQQDALVEPWRDEAHDDEVRQYGKIIADFRKNLS